MSRRRALVLDQWGQPARRAATPTSPYEGGARGPRFAGMYAPNLGVNAALLGSLATLRARCRALVRNDAFVWKGINALVANLVGCGITPHSLVEDEAIRDQIERAWLISTDELPVDERDTYAQQATAMRAYLIDGEVFARRRPRDAGDGFYVPLQVQLLEADHFPLEMNETRRNGNVIHAAKEYNAFGQLEAFHGYTSHPHDALFGSTANLEVRRIPASEIAHLYRIDRPGQLRGEPLLGRVILSSHDSAAYDDATLQHLLVATCLTVIRTRAQVDADEADGLQSATEDALELGPGLVVDGDPGDKFDIVSPPSVGATYEAYQRHNALRNAAGMNCTLEDYNGDHGDATFSSMRGARIDFRRWARQQVYGVFCPGYARYTWRWWMDAAVAAGVLRLPGYATRWREYQALEWRPEGFDPIQPREEIEAAKTAIELNLLSPQEHIRNRGEDPNRVKREIEEWRTWEAGIPAAPSMGTPAAPADATPDESPNDRKRRRAAKRALAHA